jgi:putative ABC transport system permease protein
MKSVAAWIDSAGRDLRLGVRGLLRTPGFTAAVVLTLALGIGISTALFSVVDAVLIRPLPYPNADRVVRIGNNGLPGAFIRYGGPRHFTLHNPDLEENAALDDVGVYVSGRLTLGDEAAVGLSAAAVSPSIFNVLAIRPALGRTFTEADLTQSLQVAVLSDRTWRTRFGADPAITTRTIRLNGQPFVVAGVMPPQFDFPAGSDVWIPNGADGQLLDAGSAPAVLGRLRPRVSYQQARDALRATLVPDHSDGRAVITLTSLRDVLVGSVRATVVAVAIGAMLVLLVSCANAAHLLLTRVGARHREFSVRRAVGASRGQLLQQVLCEGLVLSTAASCAAIVAAHWAVDGVRGFVPEKMYGANAIAVDMRTLVATAQIGIVTTIAFALGPALSVWPRQVLESIRTGGLTTEAPRWRRFRGVLVVAEVAVACVLLTGAVTLVRVVGNLKDADVGVANQEALTFRLMLPVLRYRGREAPRGALERIERELQGTPTVRSVGLVDQLPGAVDSWGVRGIPLLHEHLPQPSDGFNRLALHLTASPDYFAAAGIRLLAGRAFTNSDTFATYPVCIASEGVARALGIEPARLIGARMIVPGTQRINTWSEVVGVVADVLIGGPERSVPPVIYRPLAQTPYPPFEPWLVVDGPSKSGPAFAAIRAAVARVDPGLPLSRVRTFAEVRAESLKDRWFAMLMMIGYGAASFSLAALGLYAVIAYFVQRRSREFGVRLALGASPAALRRDVIRGGVALGVVGVAVGAAVSLTLARLLWALIPGFGRVDASTVAGVSVALVLMAMASAWLPARAATRVDPVIALRCE